MKSHSRLHQWKPISHEYHLKQDKKVPVRDKKPQKLMALYNVKSCLQQGSLCRLRVHPSVCWGLCVESVPAFAYFACHLLVTGIEVENITKSRNYSDYQGHREGEKVNGQTGHFGGRKRILKPRFKKLFQKQLELNKSLWLESKEYSRHLESDGGFQGLCSNKDLAPPWCQLLHLTPSVATGSTVGKLTPESVRSSQEESWNLAKGDIRARVSSHLSLTVPNSEETEEKSLILVN